MQTGSPNPIGWDLLRTRGPLADVSVRAVRELVSDAEHRTYAPGDLLVRQGDAADGLFILLEGAAHARLRDQDGEHRIGSFAAGDLVGEMALVTREPRTADVIAESPVRALLVPTAAFDRSAARHLELAMVLTHLVADRLGHGTRDGFGGKRIENFRILRCLGRGGMSVVYQAEEETTREMVALKMMSYRLIYDPLALSRFQHEADLVQGLDHENIARLKRLFPAYHTYFLVMELCDGVDLQRLLRANGPLPEREVRAILGQLAAALDYVHRRGVVHRDVKAANVMITRRGIVKLTDFGIAAPALPLDDTTRAADHDLLGTPACMAPEQFLGDTLDGRTDVYALGCLAYQLLTGRQLFSATNLFDLVQQKLTAKLPRAAEIAGGISDELHAFLEHSLRVNPADRLASVAPLAAWAAPCEPPPEEMMRDETSGTPITPPPGSETAPTHRSSP